MWFFRTCNRSIGVAPKLTPAPVYNHYDRPILQVSPWYNRTSWPGIKHQLTYLAGLFQGGPREMTRSRFCRWCPLNLKCWVPLLSMLCVINCVIFLSLRHEKTHRIVADNAGIVTLSSSSTLSLLLLLLFCETLQWWRLYAYGEEWHQRRRRWGRQS